MFKKVAGWARRNGENILDVATLIPGAANVVNLVRKHVLKKEPMIRVLDPVEATKVEINATPEGKINKTKSTMIYILGAVILNALSDRYLGFSFLPEEFIKSILLELKHITLDIAKDLIKDLISNG